MDVRTKLGVDLDTNLLKKCLEIQKKHQFNHDRIASINAMDKLIESYVEKIVRSQNNNKD